MPAVDAALEGATVAGASFRLTGYSELVESLLRLARGDDESPLDKTEHDLGEKLQRWR